MIINIGDTIRDSRGREGEIVNIGIDYREKTDIAEPENDTSLNAQTYDTELNYTGAVVNFGSNWCYFDQIEEVTKRKADDTE